MKLKPILIILVFCLSSCRKTETKDTNYQSEIIKIDSSRIAIIKYDPIDVMCKRIFSNGQNAILENSDLKKIEEVLSKVIDKQNAKEIVRFQEINAAHPEEKYKLQDFIIKKKNYRQQYLVIQNSKGEKEVFVNLFCDDFPIPVDWKKKLNYGSYGGGSCFFSFKINLYTNKYYDVWFNAEA